MKAENIEDIYELSPMQQGFLFHTLVAPNSGVYFEQLSCTLQGDFNVLAFQQAWQQVVNRHPILRTAFFWEGLEQPYQVVYRQVTLPFEQLDWREKESQEQQMQLEAFLQSDRHLGFHLSQAPLIRIALIRLTNDSYQLIRSHHHILLDGWSWSLLWQEVLTFYQSFCQGQNCQIEPVRPYRNYIAWLQQQDLSAAETFWRQKLKGFTSATSLNINKSAGSLPSLTEDYAYEQIILSQSLTNGLQSLVREHQLTLNVLMQGAWAILLSRYSCEEDIVFGVTSSGRPPTLVGVESMVGLFLNTLPLRVQVTRNALLLPWLKQIQAEQIEVRQYEYCPLMQIQHWSEISSGMPLFHTNLVYNNYPVDAAKSKLGESLGSSNYRAFEKTNYPLTLTVEMSSELKFNLAYDTRHFDRATIARLLEHIKTLLLNIIANPHQQLQDLQILATSELHQMLREWNDTQTHTKHNKCIHQLFEAQVERSPEAIALICEDEQLTYQQLNQRANQLAHYLQKLGVGSQVLVGICLERSLEMAIGLLAILKAGGAYVPLDPAYPQERLAFILEDTQVPVLITVSRLIEKLSEHKAQVVCLDTDANIITQQSKYNPVSISTVDHPAYVIYTSGSTGQPKGVIGLHRGAINRFDWMWQNYPFVQGEVCCQKTSLNFVDSVWEVFGALLQGVQTVIVPDSILIDPQQFVATLAHYNVTRLVLVPSFLRILLNTHSILQSHLPQLKLWISSGEALSINLLQQFRQSLPDSTLLNLYGSSEVAADVTCYRLSPHKPLPEYVLIGCPIANTQIYLLDANRQPVPIGVPGELYVGGDGLAQGYLNRPELTADKFIPNPFSDKSTSRLYKTGDLARYLPSGEIEYIGRIDYQVKVRGFRIEIGEIEAQLTQHPTVKEVVVVVTEDVPGDKRLVAYVVSEQELVFNESKLRNFLKHNLPDYMIPAAFVPMKALPLTPNGKLDRQALPVPNSLRPQLEATYVKPQTDLEKSIATVWQKALKVEKCGIHDNFFDLGGNSLLMIQVHTQLSQIFPGNFSILELFRYPTISSLAEFFHQTNQNESSSFTLADTRTEQLKDGKARTKQFLKISKKSV